MKCRRKRRKRNRKRKKRWRRKGKKRRGGIDGDDDGRGFSFISGKTEWEQKGAKASTEFQEDTFSHITVSDRLRKPTNILRNEPHKAKKIFIANHLQALVRNEPHNVKKTFTANHLQLFSLWTALEACLSGFCEMDELPVVLLDKRFRKVWKLSFQEKKEEIPGRERSRRKAIAEDEEDDEREDKDLRRRRNKEE
ncbi:hypothetical protein PoB_007246800 [Plakobranchus ocellatus]|uniref:Uncharacterized protein n=1 Tax=Plakobranchus ocellatus TaxID=259542 RepID=A0AAV4DNP0_9GAST|nr:hypothetical protein PoB_007246800 [Plakobranchus ocellatus]